MEQSSAQFFSPGKRRRSSTTRPSAFGGRNSSIESSGDEENDIHCHGSPGKGDRHCHEESKGGRPPRTSCTPPTTSTLPAGGSIFPVTRKFSSMSNTSSIGTTKSLSSNQTDFSLSPTQQQQQQQGKPKVVVNTKIRKRGTNNNHDESSSMREASPPMSPLMDEDDVLETESLKGGEEEEREREKPKTKPTFKSPKKQPPHKHPPMNKTQKEGTPNRRHREDATKTARHWDSEDTASYGSQTLGGGMSLSSHDTFQNSSVVPKHGLLSPRVHEPQIGVQPRRSILKRDEEVDEVDRGMRPKKKQTFSNTTATTATASSGDKTPHSIQHYQKYGHVRQIHNDEEDEWSSSSSSGGEESDQRGNQRMVSRPKHNTVGKKMKINPTVTQSRTIKQPVKKQPRAKQSRNNSLARNNSASDWGNQCMDLSAWGSDDESSLDKPKLPPSKQQRQVNSSVKKRKPLSRKSDWKSPFCFEEEDEDDDEAPSFPAPQTTTRDGRPRSAYDKNAEWYCGDDTDNGSIATDGSSVLSAFRPKKKVPVKSLPPKSEASMDFGTLLGEEKNGSSEALQAEESMGLDFLENDKTSSLFKRSTNQMLPDLEEESIRSVSVTDFMNNAIQSEQFTDLESVKQDLESVKQAPAPPEPDTDSDPETDSEDQDSSQPESLPSDHLSVDETAEKDDEPWTKRILTRKCLRWLAVGVISLLILDAVLLSIFLTEGGRDSVVIAYVPETICLDWIPGGGKSALCSASDTALGGEVPNLLAKAIKAASAEGVDLSLIPAGLAHRDIRQGEFTEEDARAVVEDSGGLRRERKRQLTDGGVSLVSLRATGLQIRQILTQSLEAAFEEGYDASYPYSAGLRFTVDASSQHNKLGTLELEAADGTWLPTDENQEYSVITTQDWASQYLQASGTMTEITPLSALLKYAGETKSLTKPTFSTLEFTESKTDRGFNGVINVPKAICLEWLPGQGVSNICSREETSAQGGGVANVVAWTVLEYLHAESHDIDMFLLDAADCQVDIASGTFDEQDFQLLLPYNHELVFLIVTGEQLTNTLEQAIHYALLSPQNHGSYPYAGGLRYEVKASESLGDRVSNVQYHTRGRWKEVIPEREYTLGTTLPLADGEKGYDDLHYPVSRIESPDLKIRDVFQKFVTQRGIIEDVPLTKYSTQSFVV